MALSGLHVACGFAGSEYVQRMPALTLRKPEWSSTMTAAGTTTESAPKEGAEGSPLFHIISSSDAWVSIGKNPDADQSPRMFVKALEPVSVYASEGDKLAWKVA